MTTIKLKIRSLKETDASDLDTWFGPKTVFKKPLSRWSTYYREMKKGVCAVLVAEVKGHVVGYVTLKYAPKYAPFKKNKIPEISDLNVAESYRRQGIAGALIRALEKHVKKTGGKIIGIGVGMEPGYGAAQRLYVKMGYIPDGRGLTYKNKVVQYGKPYPADDDLVLYFTKEI